MDLEKFYVYILLSEKDFSFYVGQTDNIETRLLTHNSGESRYTSSKTPWLLVYFEMFNSRSEAMQREREIKSKKSRKYIEWLISK